MRELWSDSACSLTAAPIAIGRDDVPQAMVESERRILTNQARESGKPDNVIEKMVTGRLNKFYAEHCLLEQAFVKDPDTTVGKRIENVAKDIRVERFMRFKLGEAATG